MSSRPSRLAAVGEALLVNFIWASSFVLVKIALQDFGPLTLGGLRYFLGFVVLIPFLAARVRLLRLSGRTWKRLLILGVCAYTLGNGTTFWALQSLSATTVSLLMSLVTLLVLLGGTVWLGEIPTPLQVVGVVVTLGGMVLFFSGGIRASEPLGLAVMFLGLLAFAAFGLLGRDSARAGETDSLTLTAIPLALGGGLLLLIALPLEGWPRAPLPVWGLVLWLAAVNTALGYLIYNHALQTLPAFEMNLLLSLSPIWTALMSALVFAEQLTGHQWTAILIVIGGVGLVQMRPKPPCSHTPPLPSR
ncbi:MAG: DMT family transporter [Anaerolineales bacterium]